MGLLETVAKSGSALSLSICFGGLVAFGLIWLIIIGKKGAKLPEYLGFHPLKIKTLLGVLGISAGFCLASDLLSYFLGKDIIAKFMVDCYSTRGNLALLILGILLIGPLFEEIFFRGFLFEGFRKSKLGNVGTVLLTTLAWAILHLQYDLYQISIVFAGGLVLGTLRLKTGSLWSSILMHMVMNCWGIIEVILYFHGFTFLYLSKS